MSSESIELGGSIAHIEPKWYAVRALTNQENKVKAYLERFVPIEKLEDYILEVMVPSRMVVDFRNSTKVHQMSKFYPGYVFIRMRLYDEEGKIFQKPWQFVNGAEGVIAFLGRGRPQAINQKEIDNILDSLKESEGKEMPKVQFEAGETVKINEGVFKSSTGKIDHVDAQNGKLTVSVSIFGRYTPVELEYWQVKKVNVS